MSELDQFRDSVEKFMERYGWTATRFGRELAADPQFVFNLRQGREPRADTRKKILNEMQQAEKDNQKLQQTRNLLVIIVRRMW